MTDNNPTLYVVIDDDFFNGSVIIGIYSTDEQASAVCEEVNKDVDGCACYVEKCKLNELAPDGALLFESMYEKAWGRE